MPTTDNAHSEWQAVFNKNQAASLYALLRKCGRLNAELSYLYADLEKFLFPLLTLEEMESLEDIYLQEP